MNERIAKLMRNHGLHKHISADCQHRMEMLAELIVKECVATMYKHGETYAHPSAGFYQAKTFSEAIMEHFGVEQ